VKLLTSNVEDNTEPSLIYKEGVTTIPRKGSTDLLKNKFGKGEILLYLCNVIKLSDYKQCPQLTCIYKITNICNNKSYIGSTFDLKDRLIRHMHSLRKNKHHSIKLQNAYNKYGIENFYIEILKEVIEKDLHDVEVLYIEQFNSVKEGYNQILNSKEYKTFKLSKENRENISKAKSKAVISIDLISKEKRKFNSISEAATYFNAESTNISGVCKGRLRFVKGQVFIYEKDFKEDFDYTVLRRIDYGINDETNAKRALSNPNSIKVYKYDLDGNFIEEYRSKAFCEKQNNLKKDYLKNRVNGTPLEGYCYKYNKE
jgi:group I intron endonuclease